MINFDNDKQNEYKERLLKIIPQTAEEYLIKDLDLTKIALSEAYERINELDAELLNEQTYKEERIEEEMERRKHILSITSYHEENEKTNLLLPDRIIELNSEELEIIFGKELAYMIKNQNGGNKDDE